MGTAETVKGTTPNKTKGDRTISRNELVAKIEALNEWGSVIEEAKTEAEALRDAIKAEMMERSTEELTAGQYIVRWTSIISNRFDTTAFKKVMPDVFKAYTKAVTPPPRPSSARKYVCPCCGNSVRATKAVNIACLDCNEQMAVVG